MQFSNHNLHLALNFTHDHIQIMDFRCISFCIYIYISMLKHTKPKYVSRFMPVERVKAYTYIYTNWRL